MPDLTCKLNLKAPLGNETVSREAYKENLMLIDQNAASQDQADEPFHLKQVFYDGVNNRLELNLGPGKAAFLGSLVSNIRDSVHSIDTPQPSTSYYVYIKSDGTYIHNSNGGEMTGAVLIWTVNTGSKVDEITTEDRRGRLDGAGARMVQDNLIAHVNAPDPHPVYATDKDLSSHNHDSVYVKLSSLNMVPTGMISPFAGTVAPAGWLLCFGQAVSRSTYANLFAVIETTYGGGDGSTTFNVPNLRGRTLIGMDNMGGISANVVTNASADVLGGAGGEESHILTETEIPSHSHSYLAHNNTAAGSPDYVSAVGHAESVFYQSTNTTGGGKSHNNMQPWVACNYIIKY